MSTNNPWNHVTIPNTNMPGGVVLREGGAEVFVGGHRMLVLGHGVKVEHHGTFSMIKIPVYCKVFRDGEITPQEAVELSKGGQDGE
jgi:hypothetical protein